MIRATVCVCMFAGLFGLLHVGAVAADDFKLEDGFVSFFNGEDLTGWKLRGGDSLDGKSEAPKKRFQVSDSKLIIDGKVKGNMVIDTVKEFSGDVHIKFQYRPDSACNNDLYFRGTKFDIKKGSIKNIKVDEWNNFEIIVHGTDVEFKNNGETQRTEKVKSESSPLGIRAEFGAITFQRMRYKASP